MDTGTDIATPNRQRAKGASERSEEYAMGVTGGAGVSRRVRRQAAALAIILPADGLVAVLLGAPAWLGLLYVALGLGLAALRLRLGRPAPAAASVPAHARPRTPALAPTPTLAPTP